MATSEMFEIKPDTKERIANGTKEIANYVLKALAACPPTSGIPWHPGTNYQTRTLPNPRTPTQNLEARLAISGLIVYSTVSSNNNPLPVVLPVPIIEKLKKLIEKLRNSPYAIESVITQFLNDPANADLISYIKNAAITAGVVVIVGTIVEDILTAGAGIADDWASFALAMKIIKFATKLP